jgi:phage FluMu gp28-like protein
LKAHEYFLPYQNRWLADRSRIKIFEKSRRIGGTFAQSYEDVFDCLHQKNLKVYFSSSDWSAADEYRDYCSAWASKFNAIAKTVYCESEESVEFFDEDRDVKITRIEFPATGSKIILLSSNPKAFRSKGGKIVWDEAAWHDNAEKMFAAAKPAIMWGHSMRILSTHNGVKSVFNQLVEKIKAGDLDYSLHTVPISLAVSEGLADRIEKRTLTEKELEQWLENERKGCLTDSIWRQEYMCEPQDESKAMLPYTLIQSCERDNLLVPVKNLSGELYVGFDVARKKHLSVIYVIEKTGNAFSVRHIRAMQNAPWSMQESVLWQLLENPAVRRACIDCTGLGDQITERAKNMFGSKVEAVRFTGAVKEDLAISLERAFQDMNILVPQDQMQRESLHSVRKTVTAAGNARYEASETEAGHGDYFWALSLALHAAQTSKGPVWSMSGSPIPENDRMRSVLRGF